MERVSLQCWLIRKSTPPGCLFVTVLNSEQFPTWCSILKLVRTHFVPTAVADEEVPPRIRQLADGKAAEPHE